MEKVIKVDGKKESNMVKDYVKIEMEKKDTENGMQEREFNGLKIQLIERDRKSVV